MSKLRTDIIENLNGKQIGSTNVDSVATLRASSFPANLERLWLSGYYGVGTSGARNLYRNGSGFTDSDDNSETDFVDNDGVKWSTDRLSPHATLIKLSSIKRQITSYDSTKHKAFGAAVVTQNRRIIKIYTEGDDGHVSTNSRIKAVSSDDGVTWDDPVLVDDAGTQLRNVGAGVTSTGRIIALYIDSDLTTDRARIAVSDDNGETWSVSTFSEANDDVGFYGNCLWEDDDGTVGVVATSGSSSDMQVLRSTDNGDTWTSFLVAKPFDTITELTAVNHGGNRISVIGRRDEIDENPYAAASEDGGDTWNNFADIAGIETGENPVTAHLDTRTNVYHLIFPSRGDNYLTGYEYSNGFVPWLHSTVDGDEFYDKVRAVSTPIFNRVTPLGISSPLHGSVADGDHGYGTVVSFEGMAFMLFYEGRYDNTTTGTELYISNLSTLVGAE